MKKTFSLRTVLTVTTGRLLTVPKDGGNGIGDLYEILGHMTGEPPYTHTLGRFAEECKPWLFRWWPDLALADASLKSLDQWLEKERAGGDEAIKMWLTELNMLFLGKLQDSYDIPQIPEESHKQINPIEELSTMVGWEKS